MEVGSTFRSARFPLYDSRFEIGDCTSTFAIDGFYCSSPFRSPTYSAKYWFDVSQ